MSARLIDENFERLSALALQVARSVRRKYHTADVDDLTQVALMWCVQHPRKLAEFLAAEDTGSRLLVASMRNACRDYARKQKASEVGYEPEDETFYSKRMLKGDGTNPGLLHYVWDRKNWERPPFRGESAGRSAGDPAEGGAWLAIMCDVQAALNVLNKAEYNLLKAHYEDGNTYESLTERYGPLPVSKTTVATGIDRAVAKMQDFLGGPRPREDGAEDEWEQEPEYVGTRRAISNAHARAITENQAGAPQHLPSR